MVIELLIMCYFLMFPSRVKTVVLLYWVLVHICVWNAVLQYNVEFFKRMSRQLGDSCSCWPMVARFLFTNDNKTHSWSKLSITILQQNYLEYSVWDELSLTSP